MGLITSHIAALINNRIRFHAFAPSGQSEDWLITYLDAALEYWLLVRKAEDDGC